MLSTAKPVLQVKLNKILYQGLYEAFKATFMTADIGEDGEDMAVQFAKKGSNAMAKDLTDAIDEYVKQIGITITPTTLIAPPSGPVTGMANTETKQITVY